MDQNIFASSFIGKFIGNVYGLNLIYLWIFEGFENQKKAEAAKKDTEEDFPNQRRNWLYAGLFATLAMTGYLMSQGMLQVCCSFYCLLHRQWHFSRFQISLQPQKSSNKRDLDDAYGDIYIHES